MNKLFAFWKYDQFPYLLGGEITAMRNDGTVETKHYGKGNFLTPVRIIPLARGLEIMKDLNFQKSNYETAKKNLAKNANDTLKKYLDNIGM